MNIQARDFSLTNALRSHVERRLRFAPGGDDLLHLLQRASGFESITRQMVALPTAYIRVKFKNSSSQQHLLLQVNRLLEGALMGPWHYLREKSLLGSDCSCFSTSSICRVVLSRVSGFRLMESMPI